jgi:hypothetical protein
MNAYLLVAGLLLSMISAPLTPAQIDTERTPARQDSDHLYLRVSASQFVIIGTVVSTRGVSRRMTPELIARVKAKGDLSLALGGDLYEIRTASTVCRQTDLTGDAHIPSRSPTTVHIFLPRDEPMFVNGYPRESLTPGRRYLLFLAEPTSEIRQKWTVSFQLDPKQDYYRGEELSRGVVPLFEQTGDDFRPFKPQVLEQITQLCRAISAPSLAEKLANLKKLSSSDDPVLKKEADIAAAALQAKRTAPKP